MVVKFHLLAAILLITLSTHEVNAAVYIGLAPTQIKIKTDTGSTKPLVADFRIGYAEGVHKYELAYMSSVNDDSLNQLVTDVPTVTSLFYRFTGDVKESLQLNIILGYSQIDIESSYVDVPSFTETYEGFSFGIGLEEATKSIPQLKIKLDYMRLYRGDALDINALTLGIRYEF